MPKSTRPPTLRPALLAIALGIITSAALHAQPAARAYLAYAKTPPMGWNSWDCFGTTITEAQTKAQADAQAEKLKPHGWDILTVDIQWYEPNSKGHDYKSGAPLAMDAHSRLIPAPNRFPSSAGGAGFKPLADYIHAKGLRFGIHIMRGIPRQAVRDNTPILGATARAADIADQSSTCKWNPDMYGVDMRKPGAQTYYDSLFKLYASWGVDLVKVDDIARPYDPTRQAEIEAIRKAIDACGRPIILSLSPGDTPLERGPHVMTHANMWRISDDFWDNWKLLLEMFPRLDKWTPCRTEGAWPDADMLPFGIIRFDKPTRFTRDEQILCMTLWSIARSPLILGADMTKLDDFTLSLLTNPEVLAVNQHSTANRQLFNRDGLIAWIANAPDNPHTRYLALFNTTDAPAAVPVTTRELGLAGAVKIRDLWQKTDLPATALTGATLAPRLPAHGAALYQITTTTTGTTATAPITLTIRADAPAKPISPDLFGIFFEDINYAADGGLYAELIQNRSFEYNALEQPTWNQLSFWELTKRDGAEGRIALEAARPLHPNNPHYLVLDITKTGENENAALGITNPGFDGIAVQAGETYNLSLFARQLFMNRRWPPDNTIENRPMPLLARLETKTGAILCETTLQVTGRDWTRLTATLTPARTDPDARFVLLAKAPGGIALDEISLFPRNTYRNRPNGLRADLAQTIADMHPRFVRFPGGCLAHGDGLGNLYRWKDTIGPVEQRRGQPNLWRYHQSAGLGYHEYFQFCEDIHAKPLPVIAAAVSCQNSDYNGETGQQCLPLADMPAYIQDILDLIEWANGPATTTWGAKRAAAGHPAPFNLQYLGIGNEDVITPGFKERFQMIHDAIRAKHPEITIIGTVGPAPDGKDFTEGWKFARELRIPMVDEHYYRPPQWFLDNLRRYDTYDRAGPKVYAGEYAAHDTGRKSTLRSALAEAAYMTQLERNGDIVHLASYAPLLAKIGRTQWTPDLVYFTNTEVYPTINYHVQKLFGQNAGDTLVETTLTQPDPALATSTVRDGKTGDLILKLVNTGPAPKTLAIKLPGAKPFAFSATAAKTVLTGDPLAENTHKTATPLLPETTDIAIAETFACEAPANSLTVIRIKPAAK